MTVLRSVLGEIARAESVARNQLAPQEVKLVVLDEIEKRRNSIGYYGGAGRREEAEALEKEVATLEPYLYLTS